MTCSDTAIADLKVIDFFSNEDKRGVFVKTFHRSAFKNLGIDFELKESFYSTSIKDTIRGMHFHMPPHEHTKIVFCIDGSILDVALDLRKESLTYGQYFTIELNSLHHKALYIPKGFAHGFATLSEAATTFYFVDGEYHAASDQGIRFDSFGLEWSIHNPLLSERDLQFQTFSQFQSPF
ncbi:MAG: dTDP-4-dehydrorhamnose 3,5-epimerase family protein [Chitinophagaceae bacterium]